MAAAEKGADEGKRGEIMFVVETEAVFEDLACVDGVVGPELVVPPVNEEGGETTQTVEVGGAAQGFSRAACAVEE